MKKNKHYFTNKNDSFSYIKNIFKIGSSPIYLIMMFIVLVLIRILLNLSFNYQAYFNYEAPFYDTGSFTSLLICLEHIYVCYYLIIIIVMVYWCLYIFIMDFVNWNPSNYNYNLKFIFLYIMNFIINYSLFFYYKFYNILLTNLNFFSEQEYLWYLKNSHTKDIKEKRRLILGFFYIKKQYLNGINYNNIFTNYLKHYDILGKSIILINKSMYKFIIFFSLIKESIFLIQKYYKYNAYTVKKDMNYFLFYIKNKSFFFSNINTITLEKKKDNKLTTNSWLINIRSLYNDMFNLNQFRHSGIFEAIWAAFPTIIIISILIPSLILLYSFEDILNPKLSVKVIGNQWYWTYEFSNWIFFKEKDEEGNIIDKNFNISYAFNSVIRDIDSLESGTKRLLEVDNRLVLPTNVTIRFLVSSSDVLHSFAVPELGFKIDANPGRLNQILLYINRPGVFYGQCSELCGTSHGFMPIVIQAVLPLNFYEYLNKINNELNV